MKNNQPQQPQPVQPQPVAYDAQGRPLYHHPEPASTVPPQAAVPPQPQPQQPPQSQSQPQAQDSLVRSRPESYEGHNFSPQLRAQYANEPDLVHATRPIDPQVGTISDELRKKHEASQKQYPYLNLSEGEFVVLQIYRHPIGILIPTVATGFGLVLLSTVMFLLPDFYPATAGQSGTGLPGIGAAVGAIAAVMLLVAVLGGISVWVYLRNQFFLTNESVIQEIQHSLFSHHEQTVSLGSIEDASFRQQGIIQHIFNYGSMRLSTEGEETTYRFAFVEDPKKQVAIVNNAVEAFKNGRPVVGQD